jgi:hypothetical protein
LPVVKIDVVDCATVILEGDLNSFRLIVFEIDMCILS